MHDSSFLFSFILHECVLHGKMLHYNCVNAFDSVHSPRSNFALVIQFFCSPLHLCSLQGTLDCRLYTLTLTDEFCLTLQSSAIISFCLLKEKPTQYRMCLGGNIMRCPKKDVFFQVAGDTYLGKYRSRERMITIFR